MTLADLRRQQLADVMAAIEASTCVSHDEIAGPSRHPVISHARQDAALMLRGLRWTLQEIGDALGSRDHSTVIYEVRKAKQRLIGSRPFDTQLWRQKSPVVSTTCPTPQVRPAQGRIGVLSAAQ